jgi:hypothetical protein
VIRPRSWTRPDQRTPKVAVLFVLGSDPVAPINLARTGAPSSRSLCWTAAAAPAAGRAVLQRTAVTSPSSTRSRFSGPSRGIRERRVVPPDCLCRGPRSHARVAKPGRASTVSLVLVGLHCASHLDSRLLRTPHGRAVSGDGRWQGMMPMGADVPSWAPECPVV